MGVPAVARAMTGAMRAVRRPTSGWPGWRRSPRSRFRRAVLLRALRCVRSTARSPCPRSARGGICARSRSRARSRGRTAGRVGRGNADPVDLVGEERLVVLAERDDRDTARMQTAAEREPLRRGRQLVEPVALLEETLAEPVVADRDASHVMKPAMPTYSAATEIHGLSPYSDVRNTARRRPSSRTARCAARRPATASRTPSAHGLRPRG